MNLSDLKLAVIPGMLAVSLTLAAQSVGIGTVSPDSSAVLDLSSTNMGMLVPRMTDTQRDAITNPADGLLVYVTTDSTFYCFDGSAWVTLYARTRTLIDSDADTKVMVEASPDEDVIHFETEGVEYFRMDEGRLEVLNTGGSVFIGNGAGTQDDLSENENVAVGDSALHNNTTGYGNVASGFQALYSNTLGYQNVASGYQALHANTTGYQNVASGYGALYSNTAGAFNVASGSGALYSNTTGNNNVASGYGALGLNIAGNNNVASGYLALFYNTTGNNNVASGYQALFYNTAGNNNVASGYQALFYNTTGYNNVAVGDSALFYSTTGDRNVASGFQALYSNTTGYKNVASGYQALYSNTESYYNVASGYQALYSNTTGYGNVASGSQAMYSNTTGHNNVASGTFALYSNTTGHDNVASGFRALYSNTTGYNNVALGYMADVGNGSLVNATAIGANAVVGQSNSLVLGADSVNVGISIDNPSAVLSLGELDDGFSGDSIQLLLSGKFNTGTNAGSTSGTYKIRIEGYENEGPTVYPIYVIDENNQVDFYVKNRPSQSGDPLIYGGGDLEIADEAFKPGGGVWMATSDRRLKQDIADFADGLDVVLDIHPVRYRYNALSGYNTEREYVGVIAQELNTVAPYMVSRYDRDGEEYLRVDNSAMTYMLINAVKELHAENVALSAENSSLQNSGETMQHELEDLMARVAALEKDSPDQ